MSARVRRFAALAASLGLWLASTGAVAAAQLAAAGKRWP